MTVPKHVTDLKEFIINLLFKKKNVSLDLK